MASSASGARSLPSEQYFNPREWGGVEIGRGESWREGGRERESESGARTRDRVGGREQCFS